MLVGAAAAAAAADMYQLVDNLDAMAAAEAKSVSPYSVEPPLAAAAAAAAAFTLSIS